MVLMPLEIVAQGVSPQSVRVRVDRWLSVKQAIGTVIYQRGMSARPAQIGDRLQSSGDQIITGARSTATLSVDTGIGVIDVLENTVLQIRGLEVAPDNGRITRLQVPRGQVRLKVRRFTHRGSQIKIETPAGTSGVRGTEFGVMVHPNGKTALVTLSGAVSSSAQGKTVLVKRGFQNYIIPGEAPSAPVPLRNDTSLVYRFEKVVAGNIRKVRLVGKVDAVNQVFVGGVPTTTDRNGWFRSDQFSVPSYLQIQVVVITPLGKKEVYELAL